MSGEEVDHEASSEDKIEEKFIFSTELKSKKILHDCSIGPRDVTKDVTPWLYAQNDKYDELDYDPLKVGKWMLFPKYTNATAVWNQVKEAIREGHLWHSKISTLDPINPNPNHRHAVMIYTINFEDKADVISVLDYLESSGLAQTKPIHYKPDLMTYLNIYATKKGVKKQKASIYSSHTIRMSSVLHENSKTTEEEDVQISSSSSNRNSGVYGQKGNNRGGRSSSWHNPKKEERNLNYNWRSKAEPN